MHFDQALLKGTKANLTHKEIINPLNISLKPIIGRKTLSQLSKSQCY